MKSWICKGSSKGEISLFEEIVKLFPGGLTSKDIWEKDRIKIQHANNLNFKVFVVWEDDWKLKQKQILNEISEWWNKC